jgi:hypothetical protein
VVLVEVPGEPSSGQQNPHWKSIKSQAKLKRTMLGFPQSQPRRLLFCRRLQKLQDIFRVRLFFASNPNPTRPEPIKKTLDGSGVVTGSDGPSHVAIARPFSFVRSPGSTKAFRQVLSQLNKNGLVPSNPSPTWESLVVGISKLYTNKSTPMWGSCQTKFRFLLDTVNPVNEKPFPKTPLAVKLMPTIIQLNLKRGSGQWDRESRY